MTENPVPGVTCVPFNNDLPIWWSKLGLFRKGYFYGPTLYLDLDVVVTGPITPLLEAAATDKTQLWGIDDFSYSLRRPKQSMAPETRRLLGGVGTINSSVMLWDGVDLSDVYDDFTPAVMDELHGDQNWITQRLWPDRISLLPDGTVASYKYHAGQVFPIVVFHGDPKPHQVGDKWVKDNW
jgi:hypothetical protein